MWTNIGRLDSYSIGSGMSFGTALGVRNAICETASIFGHKRQGFAFVPSERGEFSTVKRVPHSKMQLKFGILRSIQFPCDFTPHLYQNVVRRPVGIRHIDNFVGRLW